jgi:hypothetical protein
MRAVIKTARGGTVRTETVRRYVLVRERVGRSDERLYGEPSIEYRSNSTETLWTVARRLRSKMVPGEVYIAFSVWDTRTGEEVMK